MTQIITSQKTRCQIAFPPFPGRATGRFYDADHQKQMMQIVE
jgi:hypothetical protein